MVYFFILAGLFALATLAILLVGVSRMSKPGIENARTSNKLMRFRIIFQLAAVLILFAIGMAASS